MFGCVGPGTEMIGRFALLLCVVALLAGCASQRGLEFAETDQPSEYPYAIVFRMDDVERGDRELIIGRIIDLFESQGVPLDVGVMPFARERESFRLPMLKPYLARGAIDISMHGYGHGYREADSTFSGMSYAVFHDKLVRGRQQFLDYYGVAPLAFTVPFDFFDSTGYRAISDAGFRVFSTAEQVERNLSRQPLDHLGRPDPEGMWRLSTARDLVSWDASRQRWGQVSPASAHATLFLAVKRQLRQLGVGVISLHPQAFLDEEGRPDTDKLARLEAVIRYSRTLGEVTTFTRLYRRAGH